MMNNDNAGEIIKNLLKNSGNTTHQAPLRNENDIRKKLGTIDKKAAIEKLKQMGLGAVAEKLKSTSDEELIKMIAQNPSLLKKINSFLK